MIADERPSVAEACSEVVGEIRDVEEVGIREDVGSSVLDGARPVIYRKRGTL